MKVTSQTYREAMVGEGRGMTCRGREGRGSVRNTQQMVNHKTNERWRMGRWRKLEYMEEIIVQYGENNN